MQGLFDQSAYCSIERMMVSGHMLSRRIAWRNCHRARFLPHSPGSERQTLVYDVYDTELFGILQATSYARRWTTDSNNTGTKAIWISVDNQAQDNTSSPRSSATSTISFRLDTISRLTSGHTEVIGNEIAEKCAKNAAEPPNRCHYAFTSLAYIKRRIQQKGLKEWQLLWKTINKGKEYSSIAWKQPLWGAD